jgi:hypothetical protein
VTGVQVGPRKSEAGAPRITQSGARRVTEGFRAAYALAAGTLGLKPAGASRRFGRTTAVSVAALVAQPRGVRRGKAVARPLTGIATLPHLRLGGAARLAIQCRTEPSPSAVRAPSIMARGEGALRSAAAARIRAPASRIAAEAGLVARPARRRLAGADACGRSGAETAGALKRRAAAPGFATAMARAKALRVRIDEVHADGLRLRERRLGGPAVRLKILSASRLSPAPVEAVRRRERQMNGIARASTALAGRRRRYLSFAGRILRP